MSKITRATQQIFAGQVLAGNNIAQFGSLKAGAPAYSLDPAMIQGLTGYGQGWAGAIVANQAPALQDMNALFFLATRQLAYLMQTGIAEYDATTTYYIGSQVNDAFGRIYACLVDGTVGVALTDATKWRLISALTKWNAVSSYSVGDVVTDGAGRIFSSLVNSNTYITTNATKWQLIGAPAATASTPGLLTVGAIPGYIPASGTDKPTTGNAGEYRESLSSVITMTSGQYADGGSTLNLQPGEWDLQAVGAYTNVIGATTDVLLGIGTASGNSGTGIDASRGTAEMTWPTGSTLSGTVQINTPAYRAIVPTGTTQAYYAKITAVFTVGAFATLGLFARRVCR